MVLTRSPGPLSSPPLSFWKGHWALVTQDLVPIVAERLCAQQQRKRPQGRADGALQNMAPIHPSIDAFIHAICSYQGPTAYLETDMVLALMDLGVKDCLHQ